VIAEPTKRTSLYFELDHLDSYHRADWEERLDNWTRGAAAVVQRVSSIDDAEFIIETSHAHSFAGGRVFTVDPRSHYRTHPENTFAWDQDDRPTGRLPGLFCSLSRRLASPMRHRGFCYPLRINCLVQECSPADAKFLFGFSGNVTSPLRARLFSELAGAAQKHQALLRKTESIFTRIYNSQTDVERARFVDDLRQCRFILCPRGNGLSSIRLFEAMEAARVPVIISDAIVLPQCVDWSKCAIIVQERNIAQIPRLLVSHEADWPNLARNARSEWERCFGNNSMLPTLVLQLRSILSARHQPETNQKFISPFRTLPDYALVWAKGVARRLQTIRKGATR
jgi:hypothetical protein